MKTFAKEDLVNRLQYIVHGDGIHAEKIRAFPVAAGITGNIFSNDNGFSFSEGSVFYGISRAKKGDNRGADERGQVRGRGVIANKKVASPDGFG